MLYNLSHFFHGPRRRGHSQGGLLGSTRGLTLVEVLVGVAIFLIISTGIYRSFTTVLSVISLSRAKIIAMDLANERFELIRNLPYQDVGIIGGLPAGDLLHAETFVRAGFSFQATTTIRNVDDPYDGTIGGTPNDLSPADYKLVEIEIGCATCKNFPPVFVNTHVAPKGLETSSTNGALFVRVFDANGQPVPDADIHVVKTTSPALTIDDSTNVSGMLQIVDAPPGVNAYQITVSKSGYTSDQTRTPGAVGNPNPTKPHATVAVQQVTQISFVIDRISTMNVSSMDLFCAPIAGVDFNLQGTKLIGTGPNVLKYNQNLVTNSSGLKTVSNMEWDSYPITLIDSDYYLVGTNPLLPISLAQNSTADVKLVVEPKNPSTLLVIMKDMSTGLPLSDATVRLTKTGFDQTLITERGFKTQTDWSNGGGQSTSTDPKAYFSSNNINVSNPVGEVKLTGAFGSYNASGNLVSSTFDASSTSIFRQLSWLPASQPAAAGTDSVKMQIATNNDATTWNFLGPDGSAGTYYTSPISNISSAHDNTRFLRYKLFLSTASSTFTPNISDISVTYSSECIPPGQIAFTGLSSGTYTMDVSHIGYTSQSISISVGSTWQQQEIFLVP